MAEGQTESTESAPRPNADPAPTEGPLPTPEAALSPEHKPAEQIESTVQPTVESSKSVEASAVTPLPDAHVQIADKGLIDTPATSGGIDPNKNHELVARVKSRFLKQHDAMRTHAQQIEDSNRLLSEQKAQLEDLGRQRDALHAMFVKAGQQLSEEQQRSAREIESLRREVLELRENQRALHAKSESDDLAIAELAALLESEPGLTPAAGN
jgi:hypothetical protein